MKTSLKILYVTPRCIKSHGAFDRVVRLAKEGHKISILGTRFKNEPAYEYSKGVHIYRNKYLFKIPRVGYTISFPLGYMSRLTKRLDVDLIHGLMLQATNTITAGILTRFFSSIPFVLSIQGMAKTTGSTLSDIVAKSYDLTLGTMVVKASRKVIVLGETLLARALKLGVSKEKIAICPPSVDIERFNPDRNRNTGLREHLGLENSFVIGFVGRFVPLKGIFDLIMASKIVSKQHSINLLLVGDGPLREQIERSAHSLGIPLTITGWVNNPEIYYSAMDVFVLPSYSEGFPRTCLEAMAMKKPLIVTDVGANREIIRDGENGFIISPGNPRLLAEKIITIIENNSLLEEWGCINRKIVEKKYTLNQEVRRLEKIYYEVMEE